MKTQQELNMPPKKKIYIVVGACFWSPNPKCKGMLAQWAQYNKFVESGLEN